MKKKLVMLLVAMVACVSLMAVGCAPKEVKPPPEEEVKPPPAPEEEVITWKVQSAFALDGQDSLSAINTLTRIEEMSGGRLKVLPLLAPGTIVDSGEILDAVEGGVLDVGFTWPGYWVGKNSAFTLFASVTGGPFGMSNYDWYGWMLFGGGSELYAGLYKEVGYKNIVSLPCKLEVGESMGWFTEPLTSIEDCKGIKVRAAGLGAVGFAETGMEVVMVPGPEIVAHLEKRLIDAAEYGDLRAEFHMGFPDFAKYMMVPGMHQPTGMLDLLINRQKWEALPDDLRNIVTLCCREMVLYNITQELHDQAEFMKLFEEEYGVTIVETPDDIKEAFLRGWEKLVEEECAKTPYFAKVLESQRKYASLIVPYERFMVPDYSFMADYYWPRK